MPTHHATHLHESLSTCSPTAHEDTASPVCTCTARRLRCKTVACQLRRCLCVPLIMPFPCTSFHCANLLAACPSAPAQGRQGPVRRDTGRQSDPQLLSMTLPVPPGTSRHASWTAARASASGYTLRGGGGCTVPSASMPMTACAPHSGLAARGAHRRQQHERLQGRVLEPGRGQSVSKLSSRVHELTRRAAWPAPSDAPHWVRAASHTPHCKRLQGQAQHVSELHCVRCAWQERERDIQRFITYTGIRQGHDRHVRLWPSLVTCTMVHSRAARTYEDLSPAQGPGRAAPAWRPRAAAPSGTPATPQPTSRAA